MPRALSLRTGAAQRELFCCAIKAGAGTFSPMSAFAVAIIHKTEFGPEIAEYVRRIDETLAPFSGKYRVHGGPYIPLEGTWTSDLVVVEFPTMEAATAWYHSPAYQAIRPLRTQHTEGQMLLVHGKPEGYKGADLLV